MGGSVNTVRGPVEPDALGVTLMHEHILFVKAEIGWNYPDGQGDGQWEADAVAGLNELKIAGVDTIVDLSADRLSGNIPQIVRVAAKTALNIVIATGVHTIQDTPHARPGVALAGHEFMTQMFIRDIQVGIAGSGVRAGLLKCATDEAGVTPGVEHALRAVAQAHRRTGTPISTYAHAATRRGLDQQRVFADEGVDLSRVVIGHCGDTTDIGYLAELIVNGSYIGMDRFGVDAFLPFADRVGTIARLCERGHADNIVLSYGASSCYFDEVDGEYSAAAMSNSPYRHMHLDVIPALKLAGVTQKQLLTMLVDNPRRILQGCDSY
jgi:phosphotriesterase-related protein